MNASQNEFQFAPADLLAALDEVLEIVKAKGAELSTAT